MMKETNDRHGREWAETGISVWFGLLLLYIVDLVLANISIPVGVDLV